MRSILILLFLVLGTKLHATTPTGKNQSLNSPDQIPEGLAKSDWHSIRAAYEAGRHAFHAVDGGWQARNPGQQWTTKFDGRGFLATPRDGSWTWGLELASYGFGDRQQPIQGKPKATTNGQRLSYQWDTNLQEWFVNDQRGLEHGFIVKNRPQTASATPSATLDFLLTTRGNLRPSVTSDAKGVSFHDGQGNNVLNYTGLKVWDADGKILASHFEEAGEKHVLLHVEEQGARYPITIDPIAQQAYLKAGNNGPSPSDNFGYSVAVAIDTVVVGAPYEDSGTTGVNSTPNESGPDSGAAYVFVRSGTSWTQQAYLKASNTGHFDLFGYSVSVSGDTAVVGATSEDSSTTGVNSTPNESAGDSGAAYVFVRSAGVWSQQAYLKASNTGASDNFGWSVAVSGNTVAVGAPYEDSSTTGVNSTPNESAGTSGAAYVFERSGTTWSQQAFLKASNTGAGDNFGGSVSISADTVVVGATSEDSSTFGVNSTPNESAGRSGAAYVFVRSGTVWNQQAYLKASNTAVDDQFGYSVAVSGDTVVVGAPRNISASGAVYVFFRNGSTWSQQAYLKAIKNGASDEFGYSVAVNGDTLVVGAPFEDSSTTGINSAADEYASMSGAAYVFVRNGTTWSQQAYLKASNAESADLFGNSVAVSGDTVLVGAWGEDSSTTGVNSPPNESASASGAAYVFVRSGTTWSQQAYLKASNTPPNGSSGQNDQFGTSVAVSGDTVVVGAHLEDSSTSGINSTPNESAANAGAAYVFVRSGTAWSQQAYLKASNAGQFDEFGFAVAVNGDTVVVGARKEASSTTGINSTANNSAFGSGAAYVFVRSGATWSQQAYLKASNTAAEDYFGTSVAVSGDIVVVGAHLEDSSTTLINSTPNESAANAGAAYVFVRSGTAWSQQAYLKASNTGQNDNFGLSVAASGDIVVVGAPYEDSNRTGVNSTPNETGTGSGAAYVFVRSGTTWSQSAYLKASNTGQNDNFGLSVSASGDTVVVGAPYEGDSGAWLSGAAYVFVRSGTTWSQQAYIKASPPGSDDYFGTSVAVSGDILVVGTPNEDGNGAAYLAVRSGATWSQRAHLKASNIGQGDFFGISVAVSAETVVVGAPHEDSNTSGINSAPNEGANSSGAAYISIYSSDPPSLASPTISNIGSSTATLIGDVTADGGAAMTARGFVYAPTATNSNPLLGGGGVINLPVSGTTGVFSANVTGLTGGTSYSYKAYATNSIGTTYTAVATFTTLSANANLSNLVVSGATLSPAFASGTTSYTSQVPNTTTSVTVTPTAANSFGTIQVNGLAVPYGSASGPISLNVGSNVISTVVTAQNGTTRTYTLTVIRAAALPTVTSPTSGDITTNSAILGGNVSADGGGAISERGVVYAVTATNSNPLIGGTGVTKVASTGTTGVFTVAASGLTGGTAYSFKAYATNSAGTSYSTVAAFSTLIPNSAPTDLTLSATSFAENNAAGATIATLAAVDPDAGNTHTFALVEGDGSRDNNLFSVEGNALKISVAADFEDIADYVLRLRTTDQNGLFFEKVVTLFVTNVNEGSTDATLVGLLLSEGVVAFRSDVTAYESVVAATTDSILVTPHAAVRSATVTVNNHSPVVPVPLVVGSNTVTIRVTSEDGGTTRTYTLVVIRQTSFAAWAASHGTTDPLADPDGDGLNTLLEYAFGLNPQAPSTSSNLPRSETITVGENKTVLRIVFTRPKVAGGVSYDVEFSNDPGMNTISTAGAYLTVDNGDGTETVVVNDIPPPDSSFPSRFGRVRIVKAE